MNNQLFYRPPPQNLHSTPNYVQYKRTAYRAPSPPVQRNYIPLTSFAQNPAQRYGNMVTIYQQPFKGGQNRYRNVMRAQRSKSARESQIPPQQIQAQMPQPQQPVISFYQKNRPQSAASQGSRLPNGHVKEYQRPYSTNGIYRTVPQEHQKIQQQRNIPETNRLAPQALKHTNLKEQIENVRRKREKEHYNITNRPPSANLVMYPRTAVTGKYAHENQRPQTSMGVAGNGNNNNNIIINNTSNSRHVNDKDIIVNDASCSSSSSSSSSYSSYSTSNNNNSNSNSNSNHQHNHHQQQQQVVKYVYPSKYSESSPRGVSNNHNNKPLMAKEPINTTTTTTTTNTIINKEEKPAINTSLPKNNNNNSNHDNSISSATPNSTITSKANVSNITSNTSTPTTNNNRAQSAPPPSQSSYSSNANSAASTPAVSTRKLASNNNTTPSNSNNSVNQRSRSASNSSNNVTNSSNNNKPYEIQSDLARGRIENYTFGKVLGQGSYGKVSQGIHNLTGQTVAIKVYEKQKLKDISQYRRIKQEIVVMEHSNYPSLIRIYEHFETSTCVYLIIEYSGGGNLCQYVKDRHRLSENEARDYFYQLCKGISYMHHKNIIHRDIKLENILFEDKAKKHIKLGDFGFSIRMRDSEKPLAVFCGTPTYMAPEIVRRQKYKGKPVDIWSMAVLLYSMVIGRFPFSAKSYPELYKKIAVGNIVLPDTMSGTLKDLLSRMFVVDPSKRMTIDEVLNHAWVACCNPAGKLERPLYLPSDNPNDDIIPNVLSKMEENGFNSNEVKLSILNKQRNYLSTCYYLFKWQMGIKSQPRTPRRSSRTNSSSNSSNGNNYNNRSSSVQSGNNVYNTSTPPQLRSSTPTTTTTASSTGTGTGTTGGNDNRNSSTPTTGVKHRRPSVHGPGTEEDLDVKEMIDLLV